MKSVSRAGVKLWAPPSIVKFGCLVHDVQLSSRARRICRMVSESSIQIVMFASPVSLRMVFLMFWGTCMRVERRRWPQTQTSSLPVMFQSVSLAIPRPSALKFLRQIAHSGDKLEAAAGRDAPRFHHECAASTFMTPTHVTYMVHACSAAVARATAKAARKYAHARAISHSVRENTLARPAIVQPSF